MGASGKRRSRPLVAELRRQGIKDERTLAAIARVPRDRFVPSAIRERAWENHALPIGAGQTISQPFVVAAMTEALALTGGERVLEIGTGSGYQTAVLAELADSVVSIERHAELAAGAERLLADLGYANTEIHVGDGSTGWPAAAPYDRIIATAAAPRLPRPLLAQLRPDGGRLVMPVGPPEDQHLVAVDRDGERYDERRLGPVRFVPLIGRAGWAPSQEKRARHRVTGWRVAGGGSSEGHRGLALTPTCSLSEPAATGEGAPTARQLPGSCEICSLTDPGGGTKGDYRGKAGTSVSKSQPSKKAVRSRPAMVSARAMKSSVVALAPP
jgi:protein-L-isoaspartate(D-aspartate) O-methyltransferase